MSRKAEFYQGLADQAAEMRNDEYRRGWNECMTQVMKHDKSWSSPGKGTLVVERPKRLPPAPTEGLTYVAGPMSNIGPPTWNYPAFAAMAFKLREAGVNVVSPHELHDADETVPWDRYLREDLARLVKCTRVVFLPGWAKSSGASLEHAVAKALGLELIFPEEFEEWFRAR